MKWAELAEIADRDRWVLKLGEIRLEQAEHPGEWGELYVGAYSTCRTYLKRLRARQTPSRYWVALETSGYVFRVTQLGAHRGALWARWAPLEIDLRGTVAVANQRKGNPDGNNNQNPRVQTAQTKRHGGRVREAQSERGSQASSTTSGEHC